MDTEQLARQVTGKSYNSLWKLLLIGFLILMLMIPVVWISTIIHERYQRKESVFEEIAGKRGGDQILSGPFLSVPYDVVARESGNGAAAKAVTRYLHFSPDSLLITGTAKTDTHKRGIFKVSGFQADLASKAYFPSDMAADPACKGLPLRWNEALLTFGLEDQRGLKELSGSANGLPLSFNRAEGILTFSSLAQTAGRKRFMPGKDITSEEMKDFGPQLASQVPVDPSVQGLVVNLGISLTGTRQLRFASSALREKVDIKGDWPSPSFIGDLLPEARELAATGFRAQWQSSGLNSGVKKVWKSEGPIPRLSNFGVDFLIMVDSYQQTTRALKYSVMFLLLTFMTFFLAEIKTRQRIHPIQYLMVGCALILFYLLLLSLSEHLAFGWAYLIAAAAVVLQIGVYCFSILKTRKFALQVGALLAFLYAFLYLLLRLEDSALLVGSLSLFVLLSVAMYIMRNINWYNQG